MPNISLYLLRTFDISVYMYSYEGSRSHRAPHVHVHYKGEKATVGIPGGELLAGTVPTRVLRKVRAWIELNDEGLMQLWEKAKNGETLTKID